MKVDKFRNVGYIVIYLYLLKGVKKIEAKIGNDRFQIVDKFVVFCCCIYYAIAISPINIYLQQQQQKQYRHDGCIGKTFRGAKTYIYIYLVIGIT